MEFNKIYLFEGYLHSFYETINTDLPATDGIRMWAK